MCNYGEAGGIRTWGVEKLGEIGRWSYSASCWRQASRYAAWCVVEGRGVDIWDNLVIGAAWGVAARREIVGVAYFDVRGRGSVGRGLH